MNFFKTLLSSALVLATIGFAPVTFAEEAAAPAVAPPVVNKPDTLGDLLDNINQRRVTETRDHSAREKRFRADKAAQARMLANAEAERRREEQKSDRLETQFEENELRIGQLQEQLDNRLGSLRELFGVLQQVAGDTSGRFAGSLISAEYPDRGEWMDKLAQRMGKSSELATIEEMENLWSELEREMIESGKITKFSTTVVTNSGERIETNVIRVGAFGIVGNGEYLEYNLSTSSVIELPRQPAGRFTGTISDLEGASAGEVVAVAIDPTRGSLLGLLIQAATVGERVGGFFSGISECGIPFCDGQGESTGSVIILGGIIGLLLALERLISLTLIGRKVNSQKKNTESPSEDNPLGRVLKVYDDNKEVDVETLELKLGEAILGETPKLTRNIALIQVISVVAPLLGLLGTVIGMILTFQAITLFGTGDPKTMAGGISTALMTTVLGLVVAIPMTLLHAIVSSRSKSVIHILEEQSAGMIADHAERSGRPLE